MSLKKRKEKRVWVFKIATCLRLTALWSCITCMACDLNEREIILHITAETGGADEEDAATDALTDPSAADTAEPDANNGQSSDDPVDEDTGEAAVTDSESDTAAQCICECACDTGSETQTEPAWETDSAAAADTQGATDPVPETDTGEVPEPSSDTLSDVSEGCLIISEYIEGSSRNKGVELYNCSAAPLDLSTYALCLYSNDDTACGTTFALTGTVAASGVVTVCHTSADLIPICDFRSGVANFSGDDRLALMSNDAVIDAFGELLVKPEGTPWADVTLRRCNQVPFPGSEPFVTEAYFTSHTADDFSDFGIAPASLTCAE